LRTFLKSLKNKIPSMNFGNGLLF